MQGSGPGGAFKPQGSFGVPEQLQRDLDRARSARGAAESVTKKDDAKSVDEEKVEVAAADDVDDEAKAEAKRRQDRLKLKKQLEERLECVITEDDLADYVLKGSIAKKIVILPGILRAVFKTHSVADYQKIDEEMAKLRADSKFSSSGLANEESILTLSYVWTGLQQKRRSEKWTGEPRPFYTADQRERRAKAVREMGAMTIEAASQAWTWLNLLLRLNLEDDEVLKK